jgi:hypothetical protein
MGFSISSFLGQQVDLSLLSTTTAHFSNPQNTGVRPDPKVYGQCIRKRQLQQCYGLYGMLVYYWSL